MAEQMQERVYTIPLRKARGIARYKRTEKAMRIIQKFLAHHMKTDSVWIGQALNEHIWVNGIRNPPRRVEVHVQKHEGTAYAELVGTEIKIPSKEDKTKQEKARKEALAKLETEVAKKETPEQKAKSEEKKTEDIKPHIEKAVPKTEHHVEKKTEPDSKKA